MSIFNAEPRPTINAHLICFPCGDSRLRRLYRGCDPHRLRHQGGRGRLGKEAGAKYSIRHKTPSKSRECIGPYTVPLDKVGAQVIWCKDESGKTVSSHSTSYHARFVDTPQTHILEKPAGSTLTIEIDRRGSGLSSPTRIELQNLNYFVADE